MRFYLIAVLIWMLIGCDQQAIFERFIPQEEAAIAKELLSRLAAKDYAAIEKQLDPSIQVPTLRSTLEQMAAAFPPGQPKGVAAVGSNTITENGISTYNLTFEYQYEGVWLLSNVVFQRRDGRVNVLGLHVNPMKQSLQEINRFTLEGKGFLHYVVLALTIAVPVFIVYTLVLCVKTPIARRKWLWVLFVAVGFVQLSLNWTDGSFRLQPISFALLGAGFYRGGPYAPYIFNVAFPLGAIVFLARRRSLAAKCAG